MTPIPGAGPFIHMDGPGSPMEYTEGLALAGQYLYSISAQGASITIIDVSNPGSPEVAGLIQDSYDGMDLSSDPRDITVSGTLAYIVSDGMLMIIDVSDPVNPTLVHIMHDGDGGGDGAALLNSQTVVVSGGLAFISSSSGLEIVDVSNPIDPQHKYHGFADVAAVAVSGPIAYVLERTSGIGSVTSLNISDPAAPVTLDIILDEDEVGLVEMTDPTSISVSGDFVYVTAGGGNALEIINATNPSALVHNAKVVNGNPVSLNNPRDFAISGDYLYATCQGNSTLEVLDISDPANPTHVTVLTEGPQNTAPFMTFVDDILVQGNYAYLAGVDGLQIITLFLPSPPALDEGVFLGVEIDQSHGLRVRWPSTPGATYRIEISTDDFATKLPEYDGATVTNATPAQGSQIGWLQTDIDGLSPNTTYQVRLTAVNVNGASDPSNVIEITTGPAVPVATPATAITYFSFIANWDPVPGAMGYLLHVYDQGNPGMPNPHYNTSQDGGLAVGLDHPVEVSGSGAGIQPATEYLYRVRAYNPNGTSDHSNMVSLVTTPYYPALNEAETITQTSFIASWDPDPNELAIVTGYKLDVATDALFTQILPDYNNVDVDIDNVTYPVSGLLPGTTYYYQVRQYNASGSSFNPLNPIEVVTRPSNPVAVAPTNITTTTFTAKWNANAEGEVVTNYFIDVAFDEAFGNILPAYNNKSVASSTTPSLDVDPAGVAAGTTIYYRVRAANESGSSFNSNTIELVTLPTYPVLLAPDPAVTSTTSFTAKWSSANGATGYYLDVATDEAFTFLHHDNLDVGFFTEKEVAGLTVGTTYYYRVRTKNAAGTSVNNPTPMLVVTEPTAPTGLSATAIEKDAFTANWETAPGATEYLVDVSFFFNFSNIISAFNSHVVTAPTTSLIVSGTDANLLPGTNYYYRVRAKNASGTSGNSATTTVLTISDAPVANVPDAITQTSFHARWAQPTGAQGYFLDVASDETFTSMLTGYNNLLVNGSITLNQQVDGLEPNTMYYYRVRASNPSGTSTNSATKEVLTLPATPNALPATMITTSSFVANWASQSGVTVYHIDVATDAAFNSILSVISDLSVASNTFSVNGLTPGTQYFYRVRATNLTGASPSSAYASTQTLPSAPVASSASAISLTSFAANWQANLGTDSYFLDVATDQDFTSLLAGFDNLELAGTVLSQVINGLSPNTVYYYRVRSANVSGLSANSNPATVVTSPPAPVAIAALSPGQTQTSFTALWNPVSNITSYKVDLSTDEAFTSMIVGYPVLVTSTSLLVASLSPGITYYYRVRAVNQSGESASSNFISQITIPSTPSVQTSTEIDQTFFTANWPVSTGATGYFIDVKDDAGATLDAYDNLAVSTNSILISSGVLAGTEYAIIVRATNDAGLSPNSTAGMTLTLPPTPGGLSVEVTRPDDFKATWGAVKSATKYHINVSRDPLFGSFFSFYGNFDLGNVTQATITVNASSEGETFYYQVRAFNGSGPSPFSAAYTVNTPVTSFEEILVPAGGAVENYRIMSVPDGTHASTTLPAESFGKDWRVMHYVNATDGNEDFPNVSQMAPGLGYWVNSNIAGGAVIEITGAAFAGPKTMVLQPGWNQIGNPFNFGILWSDVITRNSGTTGIADIGNYYTYTGTFGQSDDLDEHSGGFVNNAHTSSVTLSIPADVATTGRVKGGGPPVENSDPSSDEWYIPIILQSGNIVNDLGGIGMHPEANQSKDRFDAIALPRFFNYADLSTRHTEFFQPRFMRDVVRTTEDYTWTLHASTNSEDTYSEIRWDNAAWQETTAALYLIDEEEGVLLDMRATSHYSFNLKSSRALKIYYSRDGNVTPETTGFGMPYPNPSTAEVTFPFLAAPGDAVEVRVYDMAGKAIQTMSSAIRTGYNEAVWDGTDVQGGKLPNGMYLYRFVSNTGKSRVGKIILR